jgi:hypothetical protein
MSDGWTNEEIQARPNQYLAWKEEQRDNAERERKEAQEESDFQEFRRIFEQRGGDPSVSRAMYSKFRSDQALEEAKRHDQAAREQMRSVRSREV